MKTGTRLAVIVALGLVGRIVVVHTLSALDRETFNLIVVLVCISIPFLAVAGLGVLILALHARYYQGRHRMPRSVRQQMRQRVRIIREVRMPNGTRLIQTEERDM